MMRRYNMGEPLRVIYDSCERLLDKTLNRRNYDEFNSIGRMAKRITLKMEVIEKVAAQEGWEMKYYRNDFDKGDKELKYMLTII